MPNTARNEIFNIIGHQCHYCSATAVYVAPRPGGGTWAAMLQSVEENPTAFHPVCQEHHSTPSPRRGRPALPYEPGLTLQFVTACADLDEAVRRYGIDPSPDRADALERAWAVAKTAHRTLNQSPQFRRHLNGG